MKKLNLKLLKFNAEALLSREQLKNVMGGSGSGPGSCDEPTLPCMGWLYECYDVFCPGARRIICAQSMPMTGCTPL